METIQEIMALDKRPAEEIIAELKEKAVVVPSWAVLEKEYDPKMHPVMSKSKYPDIVDDNGVTDNVTRITQGLQRLAAKRMSELCNGIPVKRIYIPEKNNEKQREIAGIMEAIFKRNRLDSINIERSNMLFASCEVMTLWYAVEEKNNIYGFDSPLKLRCKNLSPMLGDALYPLFDPYGDMVAISVEYTRTKAGESTTYFDTFTAEKHVKWEAKKNEWKVVENENTTLGKIPAVYMHRPTPIWEDTSNVVYEIEWALSRNGNYLRKNSKPLFAVFADELIDYGDEKPENKEFRTILQYPKGADARYVTWEGAIENLKYYVSELRQSFFTQLQLPDFSFESMKATPMSGEARKQLFIDAQLKARGESGRLLEFYDREINVVKAFLKTMTASTYHQDIDSLHVETEITPFSITDDKDTIETIMTATGGKPIVSQRQGIELLGWSNDVNKTLDEMADENTNDSFEPTR